MELAEMALNLCKQVRLMCDELIVTEDSGQYHHSLEEIADKYFLQPHNLGDVVNINFGMRQAEGDYICTINTDVEIYEGNLRDLCIPGRVVCPDSSHGGHGGFTGGLFVIPRTVLEDPEYGYLDESKQHSWKSHGVGADADYEIKTRDTILFLSDKIRVRHRTGVSYAEMRRLAGEAYWENQRLHPNKEVDPHRHQNRMIEDEAYRKEWAEGS